MARIDWRRANMNDWRSRIDTSHIEDTYINLSKNKIKKYGSMYSLSKSEISEASTDSRNKC